MFSIALGLARPFCVSLIASSTVLPLPEIALHRVGRGGTSRGGLKLAQKHFCSGHREVDKKRPAPPPPFLSHSPAVVSSVPTHLDLLLNMAPLLHRLPLMIREKKMQTRSLLSPSSLLLAQVRRGWRHQPPSESRGAQSGVLPDGGGISLAWLGKGHFESA